MPCTDAARATRVPPAGAAPAAAPKPIAHRDVLLPLLGGILVLAWIALFAWSGSPYARYLQHSALGFVCTVDDGTGTVSRSILYLGGFLLMTAAMMLPTTLPLIAIFRRMTRARSDRNALVGWLVTGYLGAWLAFGVVAHAFDYALHGLAAGAFWLQMNAWVAGAALLALAGAFQFSQLKYRCLDECRQPLAFVARHWRGGDARWQALALGAHHGLWCVGCCWALMLLMFAVGSGNIGWMLVIGAVMAVEKNMPWGRRLAAPLGMLLLVLAGCVLFQNLFPSTP